MAAERTHDLVIPSSVSEEAIISNPVRDIVMTLVSLNLCIMYSTCIVMMPYQISVVVQKQDLVIYQMLAVRTDEDAAFTVTARIPAYGMNKRVRDSCGFVGGLWEETQSACFVVSPEMCLILLACNLS